MRRIFASLLVLFLLVGISSTSPAQSADDTLLKNLRTHVKHVFIIYQENRSFDSYFGTFPGAENLTTALARQHGFKEYDALGNQWVTPFRIVDPDLADADHSRPALYTRVDDGKMDLFISDEELRMLRAGASREDAQRVGLLTMAYEDCDTIPFLWKYAHSFALYDHFFQAMYGPSTPGNIDIIAGQSGQTMVARYPGSAVAPNNVGPGAPIVNDVYPAYGPYHNGSPKVTQLDQTYATLMLSLAGKDAGDLVKNDTTDIQHDIAQLGASGAQPIAWAWYQEGFKDDGSGKYPAYITHHNGPQYFGYIHENAGMWSGVRDLTELLPAIQGGTLPDRGVFFVKGGYINPFGLKPANPDPTVQKAFVGDDDHPAYADSHISEALVAKIVNAIARSKYWADSAIIITWDDAEGYYDHVPPPQFEPCPDKHPCGDGPRVPFILISPYAKSGAIVKDAGDHASVVKFIDTLYDLPALASLPDEKPYLPQGPRDANPKLTDLLGGFDPARLAGIKPPIAATAAQIPDAEVDAIPPRMSCRTLRITPAVPAGGMSAPPKGFAPRLSTK